MAEKACKHCKSIFEGAQCPNCGGQETTDNFKGRLYILNPEESVIAKNLKIEKKGKFAVRT